MINKWFLAAFGFALSTQAWAVAPKIFVPSSCSGGGLSAIDYATFKLALKNAVSGGGNGGQGNNMWATIVANDGTVCAVAFSGASYTDQWLASRVISAQKATTANSLSLGPTSGASSNGKFAISTANLYSAVQPGGSFYGLQHSNPVAAAAAYGDTIGGENDRSIYLGPSPPPSATYGTRSDPMLGQVIGGINVFGGGLALYNGSGKVGGVGVSGDQACSDHEVAWRIRNAVNLDLLAMAVISGPAGAFAGDTTHPDNIIYDITPNSNGGTGKSTSGFGHPTCYLTPDNTSPALPAVR